MAITFTPSRDTTRPVHAKTQTVKVAWATVAPSDYVSDSIDLTGMLYGIITKPDGTAIPKVDYDVTLLNDAAVDMLNGAGADRASDAVEWAECLVSSIHPIPLCGRYTLKVSNADSDTAGTCWLLLQN